MFQGPSSGAGRPPWPPGRGSCIRAPLGCHASAAPLAGAAPAPRRRRAPPPPPPQLAGQGQPPLQQRQQRQQQHQDEEQGELDGRIRRAQQQLQEREREHDHEGAAPRRRRAAGEPGGRGGEPQSGAGEPRARLQRSAAGPPARRRSREDPDEPAQQRSRAPPPRERGDPAARPRATAPPPAQPAPPTPAAAQQALSGFPHFYGYGPSQKWHLPTGLAVTWLGTSSGTPTRDRNISCTLLRARRAVYMVDCGEGSLAQLRLTGVDPGYVEAIFVTHLHGDHCFGLASMAAAVIARKTARRGAPAAAGGESAPGGKGGRRRRSSKGAKDAKGGDEEEQGAASAAAGLSIYGPPGLSELLRAQMVLTGLQHRLELPLAITEFVEDERDAHAPVALNEGGTVMLARQAPEPDRLEPGPELRERLRGAGLQGMDLEGPRSYVQNDYKAQPGLVWRVDCGHASVTAAQLQHRMPCWGYVFDEKLPGEDDPEGRAALRGLHARALAAGAKRAEAAAGEGGEGKGDGGAAAAAAAAAASAALAAAEGDVSEGDGLPPVAPRRVVILGDTMDSAALAPACLGADLISHEATYSRGMESKALRAQHSTAWMAGQFAGAVAARSLVLTHFSARYRALSAGGGGEGDARRSHWSRPGAAGGRDGGREGGGGGGEVEADQGTLEALIGEAVAEFGSPAVCTAKDLFTVHVSFRPAEDAL